MSEYWLLCFAYCLCIRVCVCMIFGFLVFGPSSVHSTLSLFDRTDFYYIFFFFFNSIHIDPYYTRQTDLHLHTLTYTHKHWHVCAKWARASQWMKTAKEEMKPKKKKRNQRDREKKNQNTNGTDYKEIDTLITNWVYACECKPYVFVMVFCRLTHAWLYLYLVWFSAPIHSHFLSDPFLSAGGEIFKWFFFPLIFKHLLLICNNVYPPKKSKKRNLPFLMVLSLDMETLEKNSFRVNKCIQMINAIEFVEF